MLRLLRLLLLLRLAETAAEETGACWFGGRRVTKKPPSLLLWLLCRRSEQPTTCRTLLLILGLSSAEQTARGGLRGRGTGSKASKRARFVRCISKRTSTSCLVLRLAEERHDGRSARCGRIPSGKKNNNPVGMNGAIDNWSIMIIETQRSADQSIFATAPSRDWRWG